jgi:hypothetical protein
VGPAVVILAKWRPLNVVLGLDLSIGGRTRHRKLARRQSIRAGNDLRVEPRRGLTSSPLPSWRGSVLVSDGPDKPGHDGGAGVTR